MVKQQYSEITGIMVKLFNHYIPQYVLLSDRNEQHIY